MSFKNDRIYLIEHLALYSPLALKKFCKRFQNSLSLSQFEFDYENETELAWIEMDGLE
ncbi:hypothetical protein [Leptospira stimsonii]|uniref:hypothetical protein n=1 Tax=Leptospira stimsonii TaxID=2202203 RepID=UPI001FED803C|nr:hypothetical protein [Leptospira stimsonii]